MFLECVYAARGDYLVTRNQKQLVMYQFEFLGSILNLR